MPHVDASGMINALGRSAVARRLRAVRSCAHRLVRRRERRRAEGDARRGEGARFHNRRAPVGGCYAMLRARRHPGTPASRHFTGTPSPSPQARGAVVPGDTFRMAGLGAITRFAPRDAGRQFRREAGTKKHAVLVGVHLRGRRFNPYMAEKREKKEKKDTPAAVNETPVAAAPVEKKSTPPRPRIPQLAKKNKSRLPRRQKKAFQKAPGK